MGILCAKKDCQRAKEYGLFCVVHRVMPRLPGEHVKRCSAHFCSEPRKAGTLFCSAHQRVMDRQWRINLAAWDSPVKPFRAPLPDRKVKASDPARTGVRKLVVKWLPGRKRYEASCTYTNVVGHGDSPGEAIRNWKYWFEIPY